MKHSSALSPAALSRLAVTAAISVFALLPVFANAQGPQMEQKVAAMKQAQAANKQKLAQYTWHETDTISVKGDVKDTKSYQVAMGPNGQPQKTEIGENKASSPDASGGRLKRHVVEKKTEEFKEYGQKVAALAKQYTTPDPERLMQAKQQGNISLQPGPAGPALVIKNYVKPGDQVTMTLNEQTHSPTQVQVSSYLDDPKDVVTIAAQFGQLPDGTNHVATTEVNGVSKQLTVTTKNSNYQRR
jgi:hypothetical protein